MQATSGAILLDLLSGGELSRLAASLQSVSRRDVEALRIQMDDLLGRLPGMLGGHLIDLMKRGYREIPSEEGRLRLHDAVGNVLALIDTKKFADAAVRLLELDRVVRGAHAKSSRVA